MSDRELERPATFWECLNILAVQKESLKRESGNTKTILQLCKTKCGQNAQEMKHRIDGTMSINFIKLTPQKLIC